VGFGKVLNVGKPSSVLWKLLGKNIDLDTGSSRRKSAQTQGALLIHTEALVKEREIINLPQAELIPRQLFPNIMVELMKAKIN
jgi:hypothetical protein